MRNRPIYHITHLANLPGILGAGRVWSDSQCRIRGCTANDVGYSHIKARRMQRAVPVHPGTTLGQFVPFNFCPRSVMLYVLHRGHDSYCGGQDDIVHLVSTVGDAIDTGQLWAFTDRHADLGYAEYFRELGDESQVHWQAMPLTYWAEGETKERRQAEFLVYDWFPWDAIAGIGVANPAAQARVQSLLANSRHQPTVRVQRDWYY